MNSSTFKYKLFNDLKVYMYMYTYNGERQSFMVEEQKENFFSLYINKWDN